jgi:hypothetical protein
MYVTPWMKNPSVMLLNGDCRHFLELSAIGTVTSACMIYQQVSIDQR